MGDEDQYGPYDGAEAKQDAQEYAKQAGDVRELLEFTVVLRAPCGHVEGSACASCGEMSKGGAGRWAAGRGAAVRCGRSGAGGVGGRRRCGAAGAQRRACE